MPHPTCDPTLKPHTPHCAWICTLQSFFGHACLVLALSSCGGGGGAGSSAITPTNPSVSSGGTNNPNSTSTTTSSTNTPTATTAIDYPHSLVVGVSGFQDLVLTPMVSAPAVLTAPSASQLLKAGANLVLTQYTNANLPGLSVACISGVGSTTNINSDINLGDYSQSAALMMSANWNAIDPVLAWSKASASGASWQGWEDCGIKPEGPPTPASTLVPNAQGGYSEAIFDGNPGTTFNVLANNYTAAQVASMLSPSGLVSTVNPKRSLLLTLRAYADNAGHQIWVEMGYPLTPTDPTQGFVSLYVAN